MVHGDVQDWFGNLLLYCLVHHGGYVVTAGLKLGGTLLVAYLINDLFSEKHTVLSLGMSLLCLYSIGERMMIRTSFFGLLLTVVLIWLWNRARRDSAKSLYFIPPLLVVWSNLHGSFQLGLVLLFALLIGFSLEWMLGKRVTRRHVITGFVVLIVTVLGVVFVKPYPDRIPLERFKSAAGAAISTGGVNSGVASGNGSGSILKTLTHDLIKQERPYRSREFGYTLESIEGFPEYSMLFILLPAIVLFWVLSTGKRPYSLLAALLAIGWIGLGFERGVPYVNAVGFPLLVILGRSVSVPSYLRSFSIDWGFLTMSTVGLVVGGFFLYLGYVMTLSGPERNYRLFMLSKITPVYELGWGKGYLYRSKMPEKVRKRYPRRRAYNTWMTGAYLLYEWWPYKRVAFWQKTSIYKTKFLALETDERTSLEAIMQYNPTLAVLDNTKLRKARLYPEVSESWDLIGRDRTYHVYCKGCLGTSR